MKITFTFYDLINAGVNISTPLIGWLRLFGKKVDMETYNRHFASQLGNLKSRLSK